MDMRVAPPSLGTAVANRLLDLLSTDDAFRGLFLTNAKAALEAAGYIHADDRLPHPAICFWPASGTLASKEKIAAAREKLMATICSVQHQLCPFDSQQSMFR
jgi:putative modified peptide